MRERGRPDTKSLRLFIAIELPDDVRTSLARTMDDLKNAGIDRSVRWVRPEGIHITLKFLGSTDEEDLPAIIAASREAVRPHPPFGLAVEGLGSFGGPRNLRVIWAGVGGDTASLVSLAENLETAMATLGFPRESRAFSAHLTLGRVRDDSPPAERQRIHALVEEQVPPERALLHVKHCSLMESTLKRGGAVYAQLATFPLEGG
jgi:2'-5' RNA ligase